MEVKARARVIKDFKFNGYMYKKGSIYHGKISRLNPNFFIFRSPYNDMEVSACLDSKHSTYGQEIKIISNSKRKVQLWK